MTKSAIAIGAIAILCLTDGVVGQGPAQYRDFVLKSSLATVAGQSGVAPASAVTIHRRPALIQDLEWRLLHRLASAGAADPVDKITFSFYNDQLFRAVVDYSRDRTEGLTDADLVEAITAVYGTPLKRPPANSRPPSLGEVDPNSIAARWGDAGHTAVLYRTSAYGEAFRLVVTETALEGLARQAALQSARLDAIEAPERDLARQNKERDDKRAAVEKAREANKTAFRP